MAASRRFGQAPDECTSSQGKEVADVTFDMVKGDSTTPGGEEKPIWPAGLLGGGIALGVGLGIAGFVLAAQAVSSADDLATELRESGGSCETSAAQCDLMRDRYEEEPLFRGMGIAGVVIGGLALTGLIVYLTVDFGGEPSSSTTSTSSIRVIPSFGPETGLTVLGTF